MSITIYIKSKKKKKKRQHIISCWSPPLKFNPPHICTYMYRMCVVIRHDIKSLSSIRRQKYFVTYIHFMCVYTCAWSVAYSKAYICEYICVFYTCLNVYLHFDLIPRYYTHIHICTIGGKRIYTHDKDEEEDSIFFSECRIRRCLPAAEHR